MRSVLLLIFVTAAIAAPPTADPAKAGMEPERLARIHARMRQFVDQGKLPGIVTLLQRHGVVASVDAAGYFDIEKKTPARIDTIYRIASMTKPVTAAGVMILAEEGKLGLNDPVEKYLPEFKGQWAIDSRDGTRSVTMHHPPRPVTIRDLMTHTSGMYGMPPETLEEAVERKTRPLSEVVAMGSQKPLDFDPGTKWQYSNYGIATLGRIIEVLSDQPYEKFIAARIFDPLGMRDSFFLSSGEKRERIAPVYMLEKGKLVKTSLDLTPEGAKYPFPEGGMSSTAMDLAAFYQMMLNGGTYNGHRILSRASVAAMTALHTGDLSPNWGLGWSVAKTPGSTLRLQSPGTFSHGGAFGTYGWVDPRKDLIGVFLTAQPTAGDASGAFVEMAAAAIVD